MPTLQPPPGYIPLRDRKTLKIVCYVHPGLGIVWVARGNEARQATLPTIQKREEPQEQPS